MKSVKGKVKEASPWTNTGSFIKKPTSGWLHNDRDLMNGSSITYSVRVNTNECVCRLSVQHVWPYIVPGELCRVAVDEDTSICGPYSSHEVSISHLVKFPLSAILNFQREAIVRLAEASGKILPSKKRKVLGNCVYNKYVTWNIYCNRYPSM